MPAKHDKSNSSSSAASGGKPDPSKGSDHAKNPKGSGNNKSVSDKGVDESKKPDKPKVPPPSNAASFSFSDKNGNGSRNLQNSDASGEAVGSGHDDRALIKELLDRVRSLEAEREEYLYDYEPCVQQQVDEDETPPTNDNFLSGLDNLLSSSTATSSGKDLHSDSQVCQRGDEDPPGSTLAIFSARGCPWSECV